MKGHENQITKEWLRAVDLEKEEFVVKIADLGFSKLLHEPHELSFTYCGTPINMAPELINRTSYNYKADIWSLGTILHELLVGESPFKHSKTKSELKYSHKNFVFVNSRNQSFSKDCLRFINLSLTYN